MNIRFRKISRGPAWERWLIVEDQRGDSAFAGEIILTYADASGYGDVECDVLFARELDEDELDEVLKSVTDILSGEGNVTVFIARQLVCKGFSLLDNDGGFDEEDEDEDVD